MPPKALGQTPTVDCLACRRRLGIWHAKEGGNTYKYSALSASSKQAGSRGLQFQCSSHKTPSTFPAHTVWRWLSRPLL